MRLARFSVNDNYNTSIILKGIKSFKGVGPLILLMITLYPCQSLEVACMVTMQYMHTEEANILAMYEPSLMNQTLLLPQRWMYFITSTYW